MHTLISLGQILNTSSNTRQLPDCCLAASSLQYFSLGRNNLALFPSFCSALFRHESSSFDFWEVFELKHFHLELILVVSLSYWLLKDTSTFCSRRKACVAVKCYDCLSLLLFLKILSVFHFPSYTNRTCFKINRHRIYKSDANLFVKLSSLTTTNICSCEKPFLESFP